MDENVRLREFSMDDLDAVAAIVGDDRVTAFMSFDRRTREQAETMLDGILERAKAEPRTEFYLAIERSADGPAVGTIRLAFSGVRPRSSATWSTQISGVMGTPRTLCAP